MSAKASLTSAPTILKGHQINNSLDVLPEKASGNSLKKFPCEFSQIVPPDLRDRSESKAMRWGQSKTEHESFPTYSRVKELESGSLGT